jgi:hypothetical protein
MGMQETSEWVCRNLQAAAGQLRHNNTMILFFEPTHWVASDLLGSLRIVVIVDVQCVCGRCVKFTV